jgi:hypothetical protein
MQSNFIRDPSSSGSTEADIAGSSTAAIRRGSQLSLRSLFFLQAQAAMILVLGTLAFDRIAVPVPVIARTFFLVTVLSCVVGTTLSLYFSMPWWFLFGPLVGVFVGLIASALTLSATSNFYKLMWASIVSSTLLILLCCWLGRYLDQEESQ